MVHARQHEGCPVREGELRRQEQEDTVQSQLGELRAALEDAGVSDWQEFIDEGYARDNLVRPTLDRLRDLAAQRDVSKVYV